MSTDATKARYRRYYKNKRLTQGQSYTSKVTEITEPKVESKQETIVSEDATNRLSMALTGLFTNSPQGLKRR